MERRAPNPLAILASVVAALILAATVFPRVGRDAARRALGPQDRGQGSAPELGADELVPLDPVYHELAAATGGDVGLWSPGEFARSTPILTVGGQDLLLAYGELGKGRSAERRWSFAVDGLTGRLDLFVSAQLLEDAVLVGPSGAAVAAGEPGVDLRRFSRMLQVRVECPAAGQWQVALRGAGLFSLAARGMPVERAGIGDPELAPVEWVDLDFVEERGRPGHEGLLPVARDLVAGEVTTLELVLAGSRLSTELVLVGLDGRPLPWEGPFASSGSSARVPVRERGGGGVDATEILRLDLAVPSRPFRVLARGVDGLGAPWQRISSAAIAPSH